MNKDVKEEVVAVGEHKTTSQEKDTTNNINSNDIIVKKLLTLQDIVKELQDKFSINGIFLFKDAELGKFVKIDLNTPHTTIKNGKKIVEYKKEVQIIDNSSIKGLIASQLKILRDVMMVIDKNIEINKKTIDLIYNNITTVVRKFDRNEKQIYIKSANYVFNDFIETDITSLLYKEDERLDFKDIYQVIKSKYKRFHALLMNNVINDYNSFEYVIHYMAAELNAPHELNKSLVFIGDQGSGKSMFWEEYASNVYDKSNFETFSNSNWTDKFNDTFLNLSFIINNEIDLVTNNPDVESINNNIKRMITDKQMMVRAMNKSNKPINIQFNMVFLTNNDNPLKMESKERRMAIFGRAKKLTINKYFLELGENTSIFRINLNKEMKEVLKLIKKLKTHAYRSVIIDTDIPFQTKIKDQIVSNTNNTSDMIRTSFSNQDFNNLIDVYDIEEEFLEEIKQQFEIGIFTNTLLKRLYCIIFSVENVKLNDVKSGKYWNTILTKPKKSLVSIKGVKHNIKVFEDSNIDTKIEKLRSIYTNTNTNMNDELIQEEPHQETILKQNGEQIPLEHETIEQPLVKSENKYMNF